MRNRERAVALWRLSNILVLSKEPEILEMQRAADRLACRYAEAAGTTYDALREEVEQDDTNLSGLYDT